MTIHEAIKSFENHLSAIFSISEKRQMVRQLILQKLQLQNSDLLLKREEKIDEFLYDEILLQIEEINSGIPFQYVLGTTFFYDLELKTDPRALIPRPETEELVDWILETVSDSEKLQVLDIGTGSGCIALALKANLPKSRVVGLDAEPAALNLAIENAQKTDLKADFQLGDALQLSTFSNQKWDIIVSNPPYVLESDRNEMAKHVVDFEPESALFVPDNNPLLFYESIAEYAKEHLKTNGFLFFEIHEKLGQNVKNLLFQKGFINVEIRKDLQGKERMVKALVRRSSDE